MNTPEADETTQRISSEALQLFVQRGYGSTTIEHISKAAEVGVATIYRRWPDKAAIANDLYADGVESMLTILDEHPAEDAKAEFIAIWGHVWNWASANRNLFLFFVTSAGAPWLTKSNIAGKLKVSEQELATYARLRITAPADFAAALIGGTIGSVLSSEPDIAPDEVAERLWHALTM